MLTKKDLVDVKGIIHEELSVFYTELIQPTFATKTELSEVKIDLSEVKADVSELKTDMAEVKTNLNKVMNTLDKMYGEIKKDNQEAAVIRNKVYKEHDNTLTDHEKRISRVEVAVA